MGTAIKAITVASSFVLLTACGGGGGGSNPGTTGNSTDNSSSGNNTGSSSGLPGGPAAGSTGGNTEPSANDSSSGTRPSTGESAGSGGSSAGTGTGTTPPAGNSGSQPPPSAGQTGGEDTYYAQQWYLKNTGRINHDGQVAVAGEDINVEPVWNSCGDNGTCKGEGVTIAVVDSGIEIRHPDLVSNISTSLQHRVYPLSGDNITGGDPTPPQNDTAVINGNESSMHGTQMAGIIAARNLNGIGVKGIAPRASLVSYALLGGNWISAAFQADAMTYQAPNIAVSNNSWGPTETKGAQLAWSYLTWQNAIDTGLRTGRGGRGTIYVFAGGNDKPVKGRSDYDGYANYHGVIAVGSTTNQGKSSHFSSPGSNLWISAPGGQYCGLTAVTTTDRLGNAGTNNPSMQNQYDLVGVGDYTQCSGGTSAAAAMISGVAALIVQANPNLGWRDVKAILAMTARRNDPTDSMWSRNAAGYWINEQYGFGVVNAAAAVAAAKSWINLPAQRTYTSTQQTVDLPIPDNSTNVGTKVVINDSGISRIEWVDLTLTAPHTYSGDLEILLTSPSGTQSVLADSRDCRDPQRSSRISTSCNSYNDWRFGVARYFGEPANGTWTVTIRDKKTGNTGTLQSVQIAIRGH